jgi:co-chaperonin GroES (HSP10)
MPFRPVGSRAIVKLLDDPPKKGAIILPEGASAKSPFQRATVLAVGDGAPLQSGGREPCSFAEGDTVVIPRADRPTIDGLDAGMALIPFAEVVLVLMPDAEGGGGQ